MRDLQAIINESQYHIIKAHEYLRVAQHTNTCNELRALGHELAIEFPTEPNNSPVPKKQDGDTV